MKKSAILLPLLLVLMAVPGQSQILRNIKDKALNKGKDKVRTEANNAVVDQFRNYRSQFDSADFDYALLLSDNSGLFNVKKKGEFANKFATLRNISSSLRDLDLTDEQNAKLSLEMGQTAFASEKFLFAEKKFNLAASYFEKAYLTSDFGYLKTIANQGLLYTTMGRYSLAEKYTTRALELRESKLGKKNMAVAASYNNYGVLHYNLGQYNESEKDFTQALDIIKSNKQDNGMPYAIVMNNKAMLFQSIGRNDLAARILEEAVTVSLKLESKTSRNHLLFLSNLALMYQQAGKYSEAELIYQGLSMRFDRSKPEFANLLNNFATLYMVMKKDTLVEGMLKNSAAIYKANLGERSPAYAKVISDLGNFYRYKGRFADAKPVLEEALAIREEALDPNHPLRVQSQEDLAILLWKQKDYQRASSIYHDVMERSLDFINRYFPPMSEQEKTKYWDILSPRFQRFYNFAIEAKSAEPQLINDLFEYRVATKGLLLSSTRKITETIRNSGNAELVADYEAWIDQKEELTRLYAYSREDLRDQGLNLDSLENVANDMEKKLSKSSREFSQFYFTSKTKYSEIQSKLNADEALVEIIRLRNFDQTLTTDVKYVALVVAKNFSQPKLILLPGGNDLEGKFFKTYRKSMANKINDEQSYKNFWAPLENELKGKKKWYVSLDGVYNQISLYTLKKPGGDFLLNLADIELVGNPRDVMRPAKPNGNSTKTATLLGFPTYSSPQIPPLPATKTEVDGIDKLLKTSGYQVSEFVQADATEANLKSSKNLSVLHIATHGYFLQDVDKASWPIGVSADNARENVLLRSGLMLTGAIETDKVNLGLDSSSNGIMTSYEAMNLDLKGTRLVVLSACETGLGEVKAGEGVYGLQRAFLVAGAEALIMSLWKVDDAATQQLMTNFYNNWTTSGNKQKAFKLAQQQLMAKYKEPFYWGAFVMMEE
ncbi:MAG: CHAT domain-containing protein [Chitinophagaceae bacterium]|nr:CHAT domain-containing protein [Chitinophagaceae bacterium]